METEAKQEKTGSVFGFYFPKLTDEFVEKVTDECLGKQKLFIDKYGQIIPITKDLVRQGVSLSVWNIKTHYPTWKWVNDLSTESFKAVISKLRTPYHLRWLNNLTYDQFLELCEPFRNERRIPGWLLYFARPYIGDTKWDAWGTLGGNINLDEYIDGDKLRELYANEEDYENSMEHPADYAVVREVGEEGGGIQIIRPKTDSSGNTIKAKRPDGKEILIVDPLYERVAKFYEDSKPWKKKKKKKDHAEHEDFCFLIHEYDGEVKNQGVEGETLPPEYLPIMALSPKIYYKKHIEMMRFTLNRVVYEYGRSELENALNYISNATIFSKSEKLRKEPRFRKPTLGLADDKLWADFTESNKIKPLEK